MLSLPHGRQIRSHSHGAAGEVQGQRDDALRLYGLAAISDYRDAVILDPSDDLALNEFVLLYARLQ